MLAVGDGRGERVLEGRWAPHGEIVSVSGLPVPVRSPHQARGGGALHVGQHDAAGRTLHEDRAVLAAYARGVNHYLETHMDRLPVEFTLLGYKPRPWRLEDTILVGLMMQQSLSNTYKHDLTREAMYEKGDPEKVAQLFPERTGSEHQPGSNAWAVSGAHTKSGKASVANDMHVAWSLPGVWYMTHLRGPGVNVAGVAIPGVPAIVAGRNESIAWGITNLGFDVQDLYVPASNQAVLERDRIAVKGMAGGEPFQQLVNAHGPIFQGPNGKPVALRWVAGEKQTFHIGLVKLNRAKNWAEFREALKEFPGASSNVAYADKDGNIGLQVAGQLPIRKDCNGQRVLAAGTCEWQGFIPFEELPSFYNPAPGFIVTGNQNPFPEKYPYAVSGNFAPHYRANRILEELRRKEKWAPEEMVKAWTVYLATQPQNDAEIGAIRAAVEKASAHGKAVTK